MTLLAILLLAQAPASASQPLNSITVPVMTGRLVIPDEIAPAVMPYMACKLRAAGVPVRKAGAPIPPQSKPSGENCAPVREKASRDALAMLERAKINPPQGRVAFVAKTLDQIDQFTPAAPGQPAPPRALPSDPFESLWSIVAPALACERIFDAERRKFADEQRRINSLPARSAAEQKQWHDAWEANDAKEQEFKDRRETACKAGDSFDRLKVRLRQMRSDLSSGEVHTFALGFFHDLRRTSEYAADFGSGHDARQYTPPPAPPPPPAKTGN